MRIFTEVTRRGIVLEEILATKGIVVLTLDVTDKQDAQLRRAWTNQIDVIGLNVRRVSHEHRTVVTHCPFDGSKYDNPIEVEFTKEEALGKLFKVCVPVAFEIDVLVIFGKDKAE